MLVLQLLEIIEKITIVKYEQAFKVKLVLRKVDLYNCNGKVNPYNVFLRFNKVSKPT